MSYMTVDTEPQISIIPIAAVQKHCLSKSKVREAIVKLIMLGRNEQITVLMHNCMIKQLLKELNLEVKR